MSGSKRDSGETAAVLCGVLRGRPASGRSARCSIRAAPTHPSVAVAESKALGSRSRTTAPRLTSSSAVIEQAGGRDVEVRLRRREHRFQPRYTDAMAWRPAEDCLRLLSSLTLHGTSLAAASGPGSRFAQMMAARSASDRGWTAPSRASRGPRADATCPGQAQQHLWAIKPSKSPVAADRADGPTDHG